MPTKNSKKGWRKEKDNQKNTSLSREEYLLQNGISAKGLKHILPVETYEAFNKKVKKSSKSTEGHEQGAKALKALVESGILPSKLKVLLSAIAVHEQEKAWISEGIALVDDVTQSLWFDNHFQKKKPKVVSYADWYKRVQMNYLDKEGNPSVSKVLYIKDQTDVKDVASDSVSSLSVVVECDPHVFGNEMTEILSNDK